MAQKRLFKMNYHGPKIQKLTTNEAGGLAYKLSPKEQLAQFAATCTFNNTFYTSAEQQLKQLDVLLNTIQKENISNEFIARCAVYAREKGHLKDIAAYLLAILCQNHRHAIDLVDKIFFRVCNNSKMLLNFVQIIRSGKVGRTSFGSHIKKLIQKWLTNKDPKQLFLASVGHANPSLADTIKMVHPKAVSEAQNNMFAYLLGKNWRFDLLPVELQQFEVLKTQELLDKANCSSNIEQLNVPDIPFRCLTNLNLSIYQWCDIALRMPWNTLRQNINNLQRKGIFDGIDGDMFTEEICTILTNRAEIQKSLALPYQLLTTFQNIKDVPVLIKLAIQDAMEIATENVPALNGKTLVAVDVSGSMSSKITEKSVTSCVDVAALIASSLLRKNEKNTKVVLFDTKLYEPDLNPRDSVLTNAKKIAMDGGGTSISEAFLYLLNCGVNYNNILLISDNESWADNSFWGRTTSSKALWEQYLNTVNKNARLINLDLLPNTSRQIPSYAGKVLCVGGASDVVFSIFDSFFNGDNTSFVEIIEGVEL